MLNLSDSILIEFDNFETERHKNSKVPKIAHFYFPKDSEIIEFNQNNPKNTLRRIFEGGEIYNDYEKEKILLFNKEIFRRDIKLPSDWQDFDSLRFLQATGYDNIKTILYVLEHIEWRKNNIPIIPTDNIKRILNIGFLYAHGRDNRFRPILILDPNIFNKYLKSFSVQDWILSIIYLFEYLKKNCFLPGQIENWNIICDVSKVNLFLLPTEFKIILNTLQSNYRCRLYVMFIINVSFIMKSIWSLIKSMLDSSTQRKIRFLSGEELKGEIFKYINLSQLEEKFGGEAVNMENKFFPPNFPSNNYFTELDNPDEILVKEEKYLEIIQNNSKYTPYSNLIYPEVEINNNKNFQDDFVSLNSSIPINNEHSKI